MNVKSSFIGLLILNIFFFDACKKHDEVKKEDESRYFLSDIRPRFFENLDTESPAAVANIPVFLDDFAKTYNKYEREYRASSFKSAEDLENMRLLGMYYSFYLSTLTLFYMDGSIRAEDIFGKRERGLFSNLLRSEADFQQKELVAMTDKAKEVSQSIISINGYNDKAYGFYLFVRQIQGRLRNKFHFNNPLAQDSIIDYVQIKLQHYDNLVDWNLLMPMTSFTNYADSLNTFKNPEMNKVLDMADQRLTPGKLPDLGGKYPEILGPLYRFDLNIKKADWFMQNVDVMGEKELQQLDKYITTMETVTGYIETKKKALLDSWRDKGTFEERKQKLNEIKTYRANVAFGRRDAPKPVLGEFLNSKGFKRAYQCYSCHKASGL